MNINLKNKNFLSLNDFSKEEIQYLINLAIELKADLKARIYKYRLKNMSIGLVFEKPSTRTRCAASVACFDEGAHAEYLGKNEIQMGKKESIRDTARVLGKMFDAIIYRGFKQETAEKLSLYAQVPVINGLTDEEHPTQIIADLMTIQEVFGNLKDKKIAFFGDGRNNVANSLLIGATKMGINIAIASPKSLWPNDNVLNKAYKYADENKVSVILTEDPFEASLNADVIYTDVWVSMGEENNPDIIQRIELLKPYSVTQKIMDSTKKENSIFLHCLPATHDSEMHYMEVTEEVFESKNSYVFQQAENRLHTIKAILVAILGDIK